MSDERKKQIERAAEIIRAVLGTLPDDEARVAAMLEAGYCRHCGGQRRTRTEGGLEPCFCTADD